MSWRPSDLPRYLEIHHKLLWTSLHSAEMENIKTKFLLSDCWYKLLPHLFLPPVPLWVYHWCIV